MKTEKNKKSLIIVESPTKARTIKGYVGENFNVIASLGHIKDLPKNSLGIDIENGFKPEIVPIKNKGKIIKNLVEMSKKSENIYLAPDPDREGEAIAWHIAEEVRKSNPNIYRVLFHEITKRAISQSLQNPENLNKDRYESQLARRILDRLVGYEVSPILWKKVMGRLSAGRVQTVALRMIVEREKEIEAFRAEEYWVISVKLKGKNGTQFIATLWGKGGEKITIKNKEDADKIIEKLKRSDFFVSSFEIREREKFPPPPFITSTLQQDAGKIFYFPAKKTMQIAQGLYEGKSLGEYGTHGLITYMRTDSVRVSPLAINMVRKFIEEIFGEKYLPLKAHFFKNKKLSQDAHEAIRPTNIKYTPSAVKSFLHADENKIYNLIFNRFVASQMKGALFEDKKAEIAANDFNLSANSSTLKFDGYLKLYRNENDKGRKEDGELGELEKGEKLLLLDLWGEQKWTKPPSRYTESSLIKQLEDMGIGRPSTYATIVTTIQEKKYVFKEKGFFFPSELGRLVSELLITHFQKIFDYGFTAKMEEDLDEIEEGKEKRENILKNFYEYFKEMLADANERMKNVKDEKALTDIICEKCGKNMAIKIGRNGFFLACTNYPECKNTKPFSRDEKGNIVAKEKEVVNENCPQCQSPLIIRKGRFGRFLACSSFPKCKFTAPLSLSFPCPMEGCDGKLTERRGKKGKIFYSCSKYPHCKFTTAYTPVKGECEKCGAPVLFEKTYKEKKIIVCLREKS